MKGSLCRIAHASSLRNGIMVNVIVKILGNVCSFVSYALYVDL